MQRQTPIQLDLFAREPPEAETSEDVASTEEVDEVGHPEEVEAEKTGPIATASIPAQPAAIVPATTLIIRLESLLAEPIEEAKSAPTTQAT